MESIYWFMKVIIYLQVIGYVKVRFSLRDILNISGPTKVQNYLLNSIQEVYRLQGVKISDKHIEVIVRQMMQKVEVIEPGNTEYLKGDRIINLF